MVLDGRCEVDGNVPGSSYVAREDEAFQRSMLYSHVVLGLLGCISVCYLYACVHVCACAWFVVQHACAYV